MILNFFMCLICLITKMSIDCKSKENSVFHKTFIVKAIFKKKILFLSIVTDQTWHEEIWLKNICSLLNAQWKYSLACAIFSQETESRAAGFQH